MIPRPHIYWSVTVGKATYHGPLRGCVGYWLRALRQTFRAVTNQTEAGM